MKKFFLWILITLLVWLGMIIADRAFAQTLQDSFTATTGASADNSDGSWHAQTFITNSAYTISDVKVKIKRVGSPGTCTVSIRATSSDLPTGSDLTSGDVDCSAISTGFALVDVALTPYALTGSTTYAIVLRSATHDASNYIAWDGASTNAYTNGRWAYSNNSGSTWTGGGNYDMGFETYSASAGGGTTTTTATSTATIIQNPTQDLFNGILLFFGSCATVIWILTKRKK